VRLSLAVTVAMAAAAVAGAVVPARAQHTGHLGTVTFANSCGASVQPALARGVALLHSFEFGAAIDAFGDVAAADPSCGIAVWGIALSQWGNPFSPAPRAAPQLSTGRDTVQRAKATGARTPRERAYIDAVSSLYDRFDTLDQHTRMVAYRDAMARLVDAYPDDTEAKAFYGAAVAAAADPTDKSYADQLKAGAMLEVLWAKQPDHPGLAHYIIHAYDVPALAPKAVEAARRYATIAPDAPHALHMPSHTFTRLGYWQDSIDTNILSAASAKRGGNVNEALHASDYEIYAYLQTGQDAKARAILEDAPRIAASQNRTAGAAPPAAADYALAAIPARYALERGVWAEAAQLEVRPTGTAYAEALTWFARGLGGARAGGTAEAKDASRELQLRIDALNKSGDKYWAEQVAIQGLAVSAWLALADGRSDAALQTMSEAADREDATEKSAISPGPIAPGRELLAEMLMQLKRPSDALLEFRKTMAKEPNRFRALAGAAEAAEQSGDASSAGEYRRHLAEICRNGDTPGRPALQKARSSSR
jgi:hypothetical protein